MTALTVFVAKLHEYSTAIKLKIGTKLGKTEQAADSAKLGGKTLDEIGASSKGNVGEIPFIAQSNVGLSFAPAPLVTRFRMAATDAEITSMKASAQPVKTDIIDTRNQDVHRWNTGTSTWSIIGKTDSVLPKGRIYKNTEGTFGSYFLDLEGVFVVMGLPGVL